MTKPIVLFDLDNCLFDTWSMGPAFLEPLRDTLAAQQPPTVVDQIITDLWSMALPDVVTKHQLGLHLGHALEVAYRRLPFTNTAKLYAEVWAGLRCMQYHDWSMFLVTKGYPELQSQKVATTELHRFFPAAQVQLVCPSDEGYPANKHEAFQTILHRQLGPKVPREHVWVVGDGAEELEAGRVLGLRTIQTLRPGGIKTVGRSAHQAPAQSVRAVSARGRPRDGPVLLLHPAPPSKEKAPRTPWRFFSLLPRTLEGVSGAAHLEVYVRTG